MSRNALAVALGCVLSVSCGGGGRGGGGVDPSSPTAPTNPQNTNLSGTWTGTLTRPGGLGSVPVRWVGTQDNSGNNGHLSGPFTMTYNSVTIQAALDGGFGAGEIQFRIHLDAGASSALPSCSVLGSPFISRFPPGATSLTSSPFDITYNSCQGFIAPTGITNFTTESTVLTLTKQ